MVGEDTGRTPITSADRTGDVLQQSWVGDLARRYYYHSEGVLGGRDMDSQEREDRLVTKGSRYHDLWLGRIDSLLGVALWICTNDRELQDEQDGKERCTMIRVLKKYLYNELKERCNGSRVPYRILSILSRVMNFFLLTFQFPE